MAIPPPIQDLYAGIGKIAANIGVPFAVTMLIILLLYGPIQDGVRIANRVDGKLDQIETALSRTNTLLEQDIIERRILFLTPIPRP